MTQLDANAFPSFFEEVWGYPAFPWQRRLAQRVCEEGRWPSLLDLPTGAGKTAALDVALFHLALDEGRHAPRRIVLVVDRRVVVDQVAGRARQLRRALETAEPGSVAGAVAGRLQTIAAAGAPPGEKPPVLETAVLRGGTIRETDWTRYPHLPVLAASTVDQVGSRLLFRGYGVSRGMASVHAGLLGCDTLLLLDEVHLARPFAETLRQLQDLRARGETPLENRFQVVQLSATPGTGAQSSFELDEKDRSHPELAERINARKPATLQLVRVKGRDEQPKRAAMAREAVRAAKKLFKGEHHTVAVIVNRVDTARRAWYEASEALGDRVDVELLTGRMRPLDQRAVLDRLLPRCRAGRKSTDEGPLLVIATQCLEAGADLDFDGLVTECASLDALRQRFGRLDRLGKRPGAEAIVLARSDQVGSRGLNDPDPVYGKALASTWSWLQELATEDELDLGIAAVEPALEALRKRGAADDLLSRSRDCPVLLPTYLDQWSQTRPRPGADPEVGLFLHGIPESERETVADVQVIWRADLSEDELRANESGGRLAGRVAERLRAVPPGSLEALSVPAWAARKWLEGAAELGELADVEGVVDDRATERGAVTGRPFVRWRGAESVVHVDPAEVRPGDLLVVPSQYGGIGAHQTWEPGERENPVVVVSDLGDATQLLQRGRPTIRLKRSVLCGHVELPAREEFEDLLPRLDDEAVPTEAVHEVLEALVGAAGQEAPVWLKASLAALTHPGALRAVFLGNDTPDGLWIATSPRRLTAAQLRSLVDRETAEPGLLEEVGGEATTDSDDGSFTAVEVELSDHLEGVGALAAGFAEACGLPEDLVTALRWAGWIHDVGKSDPRFQQMLHGGDPIAAFAAERAGRLLAKSAVPWQDQRARRLARQRAQYPKGQRHELVSLDMAERSEALAARLAAEKVDRELVLHLVASHHGWCRPFAPAAQIPEVADAEVSCSLPEEELTLVGQTRHCRGRIGSGVVDRFWRVTRRYGWHELAWLEAFLRLADHRRSEWEQQHGGGQ